MSTSGAMTDVLIVEDDLWLAEQFERTLVREGFSVRRTSNGHVAIELVDELMPKVMLLDLLLPGSTGIALLHELQSYQDTGEIPVILCTNLASTLKLDDLRPYGVRRLLDKTTMHPDDIVAAVRGVLL